MKHLFATLLFLAAFAAQSSAAIWYVKPNGSDSNTGDSWGAAFKNIQRAIGEGSEGDEIWVAEGTYLPTAKWNGATDRHKTFFLFYNMKLFGGFAGNETMRDQRDWVAHPTILSGDLGVPGNNSDNAYHVVWINGRSSAMELDGFTITKGNSNEVLPVEGSGAGIYNFADHQASTPTIRNCIVTGNEGNTPQSSGAGMANLGYYADASATLTDCVFSNNTALQNSAGGMLNFAFGAGSIASPVLTNCSFTNNTAAFRGGAMEDRQLTDGISAPVLNNCTFTGNTAIGDGGGAIYHSGKILTLTACTFTNNTGFIGGGLSVVHGGVLATDCTFSSNTSPTQRGGALNLQGFDQSFDFTRCTFSNNSAATTGGAVTSSTINFSIYLTLNGCTFSGNSAANGGAVYTVGGSNGSMNIELHNCRLFDNTATERGGAICVGSNPTFGYTRLYHCTLYNNTAPPGGGGVLGTSGYVANQQFPPSLHNCIAWNNSSTFGQTAGGEGGLFIQYSLIQEAACPTGAACGTGMLYNLNPLFVNAAANDFHLQSASPAKNTGTNILPVLIDFDGTVRPQGPGYDMGAFEIPFVCPPGPVVFVDKDATSGANNGSSWANAYLNLQDALDAAAACPGNVDEIWVAEGTYLPTAPHEGGTDRHKTFFVNYDVKIFGGFAGTETLRSQRNWNTHLTILSGDIGTVNDISDNAYHVVWIEGRSSAMELDGFTITKGKLKLTNDATANAGAGIYNNGASQNSTPTIRNCTITGNEGGTNTGGAGMFNNGSYHDASPTMTDCTFSNNTVPGNSNGGAMGNYAYGMGGICSPVLTNCVFTNNYAAFRGAAIYNRADNDGICAPVLTNCTFTSNTANLQGGGGIYHIGQVLTLNNCTFTSNAAFIAGAVAITAGSMLATDCTFSGNTGSGNAGAVILSGGNATSIFERCTFSNNSTPANGGAVLVSSGNNVSFEARFERCTFSNNSAANGGAVYTSGSDNSALYVILVNCRFFGNIAIERGGAICSGRNNGLGYTGCFNCTFYNNTAPAGGGGAMGTLDLAPTQTAIPLWYNCIAWNNSSTFGQTAGGQGGLGMGFCLIQETTCPTGVTCDNGMIYNKNPLFVNAAANNFHLLACSPAVDVALNVTTIDFDGTARPQNGGYDMGAFEYVGAPCVLEAKCKNITVHLSAAGSVSVPASSIDNGSTGCNPQLLINNQAAQTYTCANLGANVATLKATDCNNLTSTCTATVTVVDNLPPTIACPNSQAYTTTQCAAVANYTTPTYTDNCTASVTLVSGLPSGSAFPQGITTNVWKATDMGGNSTTCAFTVTVTGGQAMTLACPANIAKNTDANLCGAVTNYAPPTVSNPCGNITLSLVNGLQSGDQFPKGSTTVTWKATSTTSAMATCSFTVTVTDAQPPSITCPGNVAASTDPNLCSAVVAYATPTYSDNCAGATLALTSGAGTASGSVFPKGATTVTWKATDAANLTATCSFTVTVADGHLPSILCPVNQTKNTAPGQCYAVATYTTPTATDNCPNPTAMHVSGGTSGSQFQKGATIVTWKATDGAGLTKTCTFKITVNDLELPAIACPSSPNLNVAAGTCASAAYNYSVTATDNCAPAPSVVKVGGPASGSNFPKGSTVVTWRAMDGTGNMKTCSFTVTVTDNIAPVATCPQNISVTAQSGQCSTVATYANATATDNCAISSVLLLNGLASGSVFPQGVTTNIWRATDDSGLTATCSFTVTVMCGTGAQTGSQAERQAVGQTFQVSKTWKASDPALTLAPNPATEQTVVSIEGLGENGGELTVFDATGRTVWKQIVAAPTSDNQQPITIHVSDFAPGLYHVCLRTVSGVVTKGLVVSRF